MEHTGPFSKKWEELTFSDNYIFCKVMEDERLCRHLLEILLDIRIEKLEYIRTETPVENFFDSRGVRLDVLVKDTGRTFDIEMQAGSYRDILLRSRYYQGALDVGVTKRRTKYRELKESYILFICRDDPFGAGCPVYTQKSVFEEAPEVEYNDKTHKVFYNASGYEAAAGSEIGEVLRFIYNTETGGGFTQELAESVEAAKAQPEVKDGYMYFSDILEEEKEKAAAAGEERGFTAGEERGRSAGIAIGEERGRSEGIAIGAEQTARNMLAEGFPAEQVARLTGLSPERVRELEEAGDC